jgi:galactokinase
MGRENLRRATLGDLLRVTDKLTANEHKRVRHVATENLRVVNFAAALRRGDIVELGRLLLGSHFSLAVDYQVSCLELDEVVRQLLLKNATDGACPGARMVGGGFGGAVVALLKTEAFPDYAEALKPYAKGGSMLLTPAAGARVERL